MTQKTNPSDLASGSRDAAAADQPPLGRNWLIDALIRPFRTPASAFASSIVPPRLALVELGIFALIIVLEWQFEAFPDISRFSPHPYWLAILLLSLQYGVISGLIAAAIAILGAVLIGMPPIDVEERYFNYLLRVWSEPILWLLIALLLGTFRTRQIEKVRWLVGEARDLEARGATVVAHAANLKARIDVLERKLAVRDIAPQGRLLSSLARLSAQTPGRWVDDLAAVADLAFPGGGLTVHAYDGNRFHAVVRHRWPADAQWRPEISSSDPLAQAILARRSLNVAERGDEADLGRDGLVAVPILAPGPGGESSVVGMLKLESASASLLDDETAARLAVVADFIAPVLSHSLLTLVPPTHEAAAAHAGTRSTHPMHVRALRWLAGGRDRDPVDGGDRGQS